MNNLTRVENLQGCESLRRLDLTLNFLGFRGLASLASLQGNELLRELYLVGNPCTQWQGYRPCVVTLLPQLTRLDGAEISPAERAAAQAKQSWLQAQLEQGMAEEGDHRHQLPGSKAEEVPETGYIDDNGEMRRPWCPATRILEHREQQRRAAEAEAQRREGQAGVNIGDPGEQRPAPLQERLPPLQEDEAVHQKNEGKWDFTLDDSSDGAAVVLEVAVERFLDTSLIEADIQPTFVRLLIKGRLLQLLLPTEVLPDAATARRCKANGRLVITMPKESPGDRHAWDVTRTRPARDNCSPGNQQVAVARTSAPPCLGGKVRGVPMLQPAAVTIAAAASDGGDDLPPL